MDLGLKNKVALVAGGSKGLGFAVANILSEEGALVSIASRNQDAISKAATKIHSNTGNRVKGFAADVRAAEDLQKWVTATEAEFGGIDLLMMNSGGPPAGGFMAFNDEQWQDAFNLMLLSAVRLCRLVIPKMKQRGGGSIVFSTSGSVKEPIENLTLSNVVRASVSALSKTLSRELAPDKIRVNNLIPGRIDTDRLRELDEANAKRKGISIEEHQKSMASTIPLNRYGTSEEYARAVVFVLSPAASYITGATLQVDGGLLRSVF